jgi:hypothetical protein
MLKSKKGLLVGAGIVTVALVATFVAHTGKTGNTFKKARPLRYSLRLSEMNSPDTQQLLPHLPLAPKLKSTGTVPINSKPSFQYVFKVEQLQI